jgi:hypothetical protein
MDTVFLPGLASLDPEVNNWQCVSGITMDYLKSIMNVRGQASILPARLDYDPLLELAHVMLKDVVNGFQMGKLDAKEKTKSGTSNMLNEQMK